ncbi:anthranilate synthase component 1/para-aminobenzoate synthetase [Arthrobacter stackebrandtii]|uniref:Anthranilate synthase component 1/para-aminobenzoate synthetase n=1 Tax=Arthrobacter stackebrandtii TaxID=272161 RepID=A0ABS4YVR1_9MICC|nr:anthranilate synthase component 1/para-aminobenzoate synthetase [Arthrobacter stackebrandtii]PYH02250.1 aminodeoxychorismate synthase component I [Arthrobacter stackebrandtii]
MADPRPVPQFANPQRPVIIAVDGRSGAGKTTIAVELAALLRRHRTVSLFHLEDIYPGWDGLAGGVERYIDTVLAPLRAGLPATWTAWDWEARHDGASRTTEAAPVVLVEGVGSSHGRAGGFLDAVVWVDAPSKTRKKRALERDGETYAPFWDIWAQQEERLLNGSTVPAAADIVVDGRHGVADAPEFVLDALTQLPALENVLAPELARRRGLEVVVTRLDGLPQAELLFHSLYGGSGNAAWLDSSIAEVQKTAGEATAGTTTGTAGSGPAPAAPETARSRFSIMADSAGCFGQRASHHHGLTIVSAGQVTTHIRGSFFHWLDSVWGRKAVRAPIHYPGDFTLGWLGYLGYELKAETGGAARPDESTAGPGATSAIRAAAGQGTSVPDAALLFAGRAVVLDHREDCLYVLALTGVQHPQSYREAEDFLETVHTAHAAALAAAALAGATPQAGPPASGLPDKAPAFTARDGERRYKDMIAAAQAQIHDGNSYEVCLTTTLEAHAQDGMDPWAAYRALRRRSPAPFAAFLRLGSLSVASTSPERFLRIDSEGLMRAEPIKGTRRRDPDPAADAALKQDLAASPKDRAENVMIVDLLRNDLSHFALPNTLTVPRLCAIESYATVHQMVSTIEAQLAPGNSRAQAVAAAFPAGSMTGAPKISTMAILDALEAGPRGIYSGAIGYFSLNAATDLSVVIRTLVLQDTDDGGTHLSLGIGGAITADSEDEAEWQEIQAKAYGVLSTLGAKFPSG